MLRRAFILLTILSLLLTVTWLSLRRADIPFDTLERMYASEASQFMTLADGLKVHYRDEGNRTGDTLVLVHGFSASLHTWEPWVAELKDDYRVISLDLPGHGLTRNPPPEKMNVAYFAEAVGEVASRLQAEDYVIVGNSMGGATAWQFALSRPDSINGLVLIAASGWQEQQITSDRPLIFSLLANDFARSLVKDFDLKALIRSGLQDSFTDQTYVTEDMVARYAALTRAPQHRNGILALMSGAERQPASAQTLGTINLPTLVLQGADDKVINPNGAPKFQKAIAGAELIIYPHVGHIPQEEISAQSVADLRGFLDRRVWSSRVKLAKTSSEIVAAN